MSTNNKQFHELFRGIPRLRLYQEERHAMRSVLTEVLRSESALAPERLSRREGDAARPPVFSLSGIINHFRPMPAVIMVLVLLLGGGVSFAAEGSLPGDILYPVKVNINEEVRAAFAFGAEADGEWESRRAMRRLQEAEELAEGMQLNSETRADLESRFEAHAEVVERTMERLDAVGATEASGNIAAKFRSDLEAHEAILTRLQSRDDEEADPEIDAVLNVIGHARGRFEMRGNLPLNDSDEEEDADEDGADADVDVEAEGDLDLESSLLNGDGTIGVQGQGGVRIGL